MFTVRQARALKGFSQSYIANMMGINVDTYRRIEHHPEKATIENALNFCKIVDISINDIFFGEISTKSRKAV